MFPNPGQCHEFFGADVVTARFGTTGTVWKSETRLQVTECLLLSMSRDSVFIYSRMATVLARGPCRRLSPVPASMTVHSARRSAFFALLVRLEVVFHSTRLFMIRRQRIILRTLLSPRPILRQAK